MDATADGDKILSALDAYYIANPTFLYSNSYSNIFAGMGFRFNNEVVYDNGCDVGGGAAASPPPVDPCTQKTTINANQANATIQNENQQLFAASTSSNIEVGYTQNLQSLTGFSYVTTPELSATTANPDELNSIFTWNGTSGYSIGFTHDHPNGTGPSPEDIFSMLINSQNQILTSAGQNAVSFYKANASVTVVTSSNNYVVTINNWSVVQTLYNTYLANPQTFDNNVILNSKSTNYEAAILNAFGNSINLYTDNGTPNNFYPLTVNSSNQVSEIPCPSN